MSSTTVFVDSHISTISPGDTVEHNGVLMTVCRSDIRRSEFMGISLFGDTYRLGRKPVKKAVYVKDSKR